MPIDYFISNGLLTARASGRLDDESLLAYVRTVMVDPTYATVSCDLFDMRGVDLELTGGGIRTIAELIRASRLSSPRVAIVADAPAAYGMARMFEILRDDIEVRIFQDAGEAVAWLQAPPSTET